MKDLITAAEAALEQLKELHEITSFQSECPGIPHCPTAAAIANLEAEIAKAKRQADPDPEFKAVAPFKAEDAGDPHIAAQILDAAAAIEVRPSFMPGTRLCVTCEQPLPSTTHAAVTRCERCCE